MMIVAGRLILTGDDYTEARDKTMILKLVIDANDNVKKYSKTVIKSEED